MRYALALLAFTALTGCKKTGDPADAASTPAPPPPTTTAAGHGTGGGSGIAPIGSGALGGMTPVTGSESVEGSGMGGLGSAAKDQARKAAAGAGAPNIPQQTDGQ
jgi:hypothetical protein